MHNVEKGEFLVSRICIDFCPWFTSQLGTTPSNTLLIDQSAQAWSQGGELHYKYTISLSGSGPLSLKYLSLYTDSVTVIPKNIYMYSMLYLFVINLDLMWQNKGYVFLY